MSTRLATRTAAAAAALALPLLLVACSEEERGAAPGPPATTTAPVAQEPPSRPRTGVQQPGTIPPSVSTDVRRRIPPAHPTPQPTVPPAQPSVVTSTSPEPRVATTPLIPATRSAPQTLTGVLRFDRIVVLEADGRFGGHANVTNAGADYLNDLRLRWRVMGARGTTLDGGVATWPSLAPGETATVQLDGSRAYRADWTRVVFEQLA